MEVVDKKRLRRAAKYLLDSMRETRTRLLQLVANESMRDGYIREKYKNLTKEEARKLVEKHIQAMREYRKSLTEDK